MVVELTNRSFHIKPVNNREVGYKWFVTDLHLFLYIDTTGLKQTVCLHKYVWHICFFSVNT